MERLPGGHIAADHEVDQRLAQPAAVAQAVHPRQAGVGRCQLREGGYYMGSLMGLSDLWFSVFHGCIKLLNILNFAQLNRNERVS